MASYDNEKTAGTSHVEQIQDHREPSMSVGQYLTTRIPTLKPPMTKSGQSDFVTGHTQSLAMAPLPGREDFVELIGVML